MRVSRTLVWAAMVLAVVVASTVTGSSTADASVDAAAQCPPFVNLERVHPRRWLNGPPDTSILLVLQYRRCRNNDGTPALQYRVAVSNVRASGKTDVAVGLKRSQASCDPGGASAFGVWHPVVAAGTTWASPPFDATRYAGWSIWADMHVSYPTADYFGNTLCRRTVPRT